MNSLVVERCPAPAAGEGMDPEIFSFPMRCWESGGGWYAGSSRLGGWHSCCDGGLFPLEMLSMPVAEQLACMLTVCYDVLPELCCTQGYRGHDGYQT